MSEMWSLPCNRPGREKQGPNREKIGTRCLMFEGLGWSYISSFVGVCGETMVCGLLRKVVGQAVG